MFKGKFNYSNSLTLENKILIVASIFLSDGILGVTRKLLRYTREDLLSFFTPFSLNDSFVV
jgi:hypothetical protein